MHNKYFVFRSKPPWDPLIYNVSRKSGFSELRWNILRQSFLQPSVETVEKHVKWGDGYVLMYSLTDSASLAYLNEIKDVLFRLKGRECPVVVVGNKSDLISAREVEDTDARPCSEPFDCQRFEISVAESSQGVLEVMDEILCQIKRDFVKNLNTSNQAQAVDNKPRSKLYNMKKAFKKRINRSHSDTF